MSRTVNALAFGSLLSIAVLFYALFVKAYFTPYQKICVDINHFREAQFELALLTFLIVFMGAWSLKVVVNSE